jgi:hypothetical protein
MKQHLEFLRDHKAILRLQLNSAEDLLVNGQREPADRGVCRHLLAKVDRAAVDAALAREPVRSDPAARARLLGGAVRITGDVGVLLSYLECLTQQARRDQSAPAFLRAVQRMDFTTMSATRLSRLVQVMVQVFSPEQRVEVVLGLLDNPGFGPAVDAALVQLPPDVADVVGPVRAVHGLLPGDGGPAPARPGALSHAVVLGLQRVLAIAEGTLKSYPPGWRLGLLELALADGAPHDVTDRAVSVLLPTLAAQPGDHARLSVLAASLLLARHDDTRARWLLEPLRKSQPGFRLPGRWVAAIDAERVGRFGLLGEVQGRLRPAFWLDRQREVWLRTPGPEAAALLADEARLHRDLALPGLAPLAHDGSAETVPVLAVTAAGEPWRLEPTDRPGPALFNTLALAARILNALALAGVALPDAAAGRFLCTPGPHALLTLADLEGARRVDAVTCARAHAVAVVELARAALGDRLLTNVGLVVAPAHVAEVVRVLDDAAQRWGRLER